MKIISIIITFFLFLLVSACDQTLNKAGAKEIPHPTTIRFASYNVSMFRKEEGQLQKDLESGTDVQIQNVATVIQKVRPDVIALLEFDYDKSGDLLQYFRKNYLAKGQHGEKGINYQYQIQVPSNTGMASGVDYNNDGKVALPNDAFGFGRYEGQYAFALLSKFPIEEAMIRSCLLYTSPSPRDS